DKIAVNLSRFHRPDDNKRFEVRGNVREGARDIRRGVNNKEGLNRTHSMAKNEQNQNIPTGEVEAGSYAQVLRAGGHLDIRGRHNHIILSYEAEKEDLLRLNKSFIGEVVQPGMTYNIQDTFHSQGYFGVKVTPLGSNLTLLEGQEDGEVEALMKEAKSWMDQWFKDIRHWSPKEIDRERIVWLRLYGVPAHAWNDLFFAQVTKPWGSFISADDVTLKKLSMDVARIMIRTSCQQVVDEFFDVKVNGEIFHLRVIEDSYGPMRIMIPQSKGYKDGDFERASSEEEEEEEDRGRLVVEEEMERESVGDEENLMALNPFVNANKDIDYVSNSVLEPNNYRETSLDYSNNIVSIQNLNNAGGNVLSEEGVYEEDSMMLKDGNLLGQEGSEGGPANSTNIHHTVTGGVNRRLTQSEDLGRVGKPNGLNDGVSGGKGELKGGKR
ncbi:RNA recognition motif, partial [Trifolium medium]|nr:RNA recognition motif [Trifolium medium]